MHHFNENLSIEFTHVFLFSLSPFCSVCVCVPLPIRSLTSHAPCNRQSLLEANGVAQLQNVAACNSIMLKMRVLLFAADNAAESVLFFSIS